MAETILSLDQSVKPARAEAPDVHPPKNQDLHRLGVIIVAIIFLIALILFIWIIVSLFDSRFSLDALPIVGSGSKINTLDL